MGGPTSVKLRDCDLHVRVFAAGGGVDHGRSYLVNSGNRKSVTEWDARRARTAGGELIAAVVAVVDREAEENASLRIDDECDGFTRRRGGATRLQRDAERQWIQAAVTTRDCTGSQSKEESEHGSSHTHKDRSWALAVKNEF